MIVATAAGLGLAVLVVRSTDLAALQVAASQAGPATFVVVMLRLIVIAVAGVAWAAILACERRVRLAVLVGLRFVREALNVMLPFSGMGGDVIGGHLLTRWSVPAVAAAASIMGDLTLQLFAQLLFAALGVIVLVGDRKDGVVIVWACVGLGVGALALAGFFAVQRLGFSRLAKVRCAGLAARLWPKAPLGARLHEQLSATYARPRRLALALSLHVASWLLGAVETFAILAAMGLPSLAAALVLESLTQAMRSAAWLVPEALGVQEGGYILLAGLYGLSPEAGLALSLTKRIPDLLIGMTGLIAWIGLEAGRIGPRDGDCAGRSRTVGL